LVDVWGPRKRGVHVKCRGVAGRHHRCRKAPKSCPTTGTGGTYGPTPAAHKTTGSDVPARRRPT